MASTRRVALIEQPLTICPEWPELVALAEFCVRAWPGFGNGYAARAAPGAPLLPRAAVGIGTGVGACVLGLEVLVTPASHSAEGTRHGDASQAGSEVSDAETRSIYSAVRMNTSDLARYSLPATCPKRHHYRSRSFRPRFGSATGPRRRPTVTALLLRAAIVALRPAALALRPPR